MFFPGADRGLGCEIGATALNDVWNTSGSFGIRLTAVAPRISGQTSDLFTPSGESLARAEKVIELYGTLKSPLRAYLGRFFLSADEADDVIQEVFVRLMRHLRENEDDEKVAQLWEENYRGWLFRVAHNFVMDTYRSGQKAQRLSHSDLEFLLSARPDPALDPEQALLRKERLTLLDTAISKLNLEQRNCLRLRAKGLRHKQIASELGISAQQAARLLQQGLGQLAGELRT